MVYIRDKKGTQTQTFWSDIFRWGRGLPREGVGAKKFGMSLETREIKLFGRDIPRFCRDISEVSEKFEKKKVCVQFSSPSTRTMITIHQRGKMQKMLDCGISGFSWNNKITTEHCPWLFICPASPGKSRQVGKKNSPATPRQDIEPENSGAVLVAL